MPLLQMAGVLNDNTIKNALKQVRECQEQLIVLDRTHSIKVRGGRLLMAWAYIYVAVR